MMILETIAKSTRLRVEKQRERLSLEEIKEMALEKKREETVPSAFPFEQALKKQGMSFICEVKKASPSKGIIAEEFPYLEIAKEYERAGADAISCLTEPEYFLGSDEYLREIAMEVSIPVLRKDFTVDAYQIYEAKVLGADAVLLICALLTKEELQNFLGIAKELGLSALVEAHDPHEIAKALEAGARIIGVNNRNLKDFTVNVANSVNLRRLVKEEVLFVAESGIRTRGDIEVLEKEKVDAVLIGETLMKSEDKKAMLEELKGEARSN